MPALLTQHLKKQAARAKFADANDGQDQTYEKAMSDLAHVVLRDKAPALLDYEVGFQLVDRDEDDEKAVGVTVFKVGSNWLLAPMFFLNGRVKGAELLYLKNQDLFVPLHEEWIDDILNKEPLRLGDSTGRNQGPNGVSSPDLRSFNRPPNKYASAAAPSLGEIRAALAKAGRVRPLEGTASLPGFLKAAGRPAALALLGMVAAWPKLASYLDRFHGPSILGVVKEAAANVPRKAPRRPGGPLLDDDNPLKTGSLQVFTFDPATEGKSLLDDLTREEKAIVRKGPLIKDDRTDAQVSVPYKISVMRSLSSPSRTGLYDVLVRPMTYEKCAVLLSPKLAEGRGSFCTVVRVSDGTYANVRADNVWVGKAYSEREWADWLEGLPPADTIEIRRGAHEPPGCFGPDSPDGSGDASRTYDILVGPDMDATAPLYGRYAIGGADGGQAYSVNFDTHCDDARVGLHSPPRGFVSGYSEHPDQVVNLGTGRGSKMWAAQGNLYVPSSYRKLTAARPRSGEMPLQFGTPAEVTLGLASRTSGLEIKKAGARFEVDGRPYTPDAAVIHLVAGIGFREAVARELLKRAEDCRHLPDPVFRCRVKLADPYMTDNQPSAPGWPEPYQTDEQTLTQSVPGMPRQQQLQRVADLQPDGSNFDKYDIRNPPGRPDQQVQQSVQDAASTGRKEIFDASAIGALLSTTQGDIQVDQYLGPLVSALDALGRLLVNFYWHDKDFAERYGKDDLPDLEDTLRNTFVNLGKVVINLKQKGVTDPLDATQNFDLESLGDQQ